MVYQLNAYRWITNKKFAAQMSVNRGHFSSALPSWIIIIVVVLGVVCVREGVLFFFFKCKYFSFSCTFQLVLSLFIINLHYVIKRMLLDMSNLVFCKRQIIILSKISIGYVYQIGNTNPIRKFLLMWNILRYQLC